MSCRNEIKSFMRSQSYLSGGSYLMQLLHFDTLLIANVPGECRVETLDEASGSKMAGADTYDQKTRNLYAFT